jgi:hypothetical protein
MTTTKTTRAADLATGIRYLDASRAGRGYVYYADETSEYYRVTATEVRLLGELLRDARLARIAGSRYSTSDGNVYSEWCAATPTRTARAPK